MGNTITPSHDYTKKESWAHQTVSRRNSFPCGGGGRDKAMDLRSGLYGSDGFPHREDYRHEATPADLARSGPRRWHAPLEEPKPMLLGQCVADAAKFNWADNNQAGSRR